MRVIKDNKIVNDDWSVARELDADAPMPDGDVILPFHYWQANRDSLLDKKTKHAVWINGDTDVEELVGDLEHFSIVALDFPAFKDGRCYSHARLLHDRYAYKGDVRAIGDVLRDQLFFMYRCGISSFQLRDDKDAEDALKAFNDFTIRYQAAADDAVPIYKLR